MTLRVMTLRLTLRPDCRRQALSMVEAGWVKVKQRQVKAATTEQTALLGGHGKKAS